MRWRRFPPALEWPHDTPGPQHARRHGTGRVSADPPGNAGGACRRIPSDRRLLARVIPVVAAAAGADLLAGAGDRRAVAPQPRSGCRGGGVLPDPHLHDVPRPRRRLQGAGDLLHGADDQLRVRPQDPGVDAGASHPPAAGPDGVRLQRGQESGAVVLDPHQSVVAALRPHHGGVQHPQRLVHAHRPAQALQFLGLRDGRPQWNDGTPRQEHRHDRMVRRADRRGRDVRFGFDPPRPGEELHQNARCR